MRQSWGFLLLTFASRFSSCTVSDSTNTISITKDGVTDEVLLVESFPCSSFNPIDVPTIQSIQDENLVDERPGACHTIDALLASEFSKMHSGSTVCKMHPMNFLTDEKKLNAELEIRLKITEMDLVKLILDQRKSFKPQNLLLKIHSWIIKMTQSVFLESKLNLISAVLEYIVEWQLECSHHSRMGRAITYFVAETIEIIDTHSDCLDPNDIIDFALNLIIVYFQFPEVYYYDSVGIPENGKFPCETREKIRKLAHDAKTMCAERTALVHYDIASQGLEAARMGLSHVKNQNCRFDHLDICEYNQIEAIDKVLLDSLQFAETFVKQSDDYLTEVLETDPTSISGDRLKLLYERLSFSSKSARLQVELLLNQLGFLSNRLI